MNHVSEHAGFAETSELLEKLQTEHDALVAEQLDLWARLAHKATSPVAVEAGTPADTARALLTGVLPPSPADAYGALRDREMEIRQRLEVISATLRALPSYRERQRDAARAERLGELAPKFDKVRARFASAVRELRGAMADEDALLAEVVAGGFGLQEPVNTSAVWLNRGLLEIQP